MFGRRKQQQRHIKEFLKEYSPRKELISSSTSTTTEEEEGQGRCCLLIVSTTSGFGNATKLAPRVIQNLLSSSKFDRLTVIPTDHQGHIYEIMYNEPLKNYEIVVILGGDGAFSEAVNGMLSRRQQDQQKQITLAHCPGGSGCSTSGNTMNVWKGSEIDKACDIICNKGKIGSMDVIEITKDDKTYYSISSVAGGIYTDTIELADKYYKWTYTLFGPTARYAFGMIHALYKYGQQDNNRRIRYTIEYTDDSQKGKEIVELSTNGFAIYNDGRVMEHARYSKTRYNSGDLSLALDKKYMGLIKQLQYMDTLAKQQETQLEGEAFVENRFIRDNIKSIKIEPIIAAVGAGEASTKDRKYKSSSSTTRPLTFFMDGEKGYGNVEYMVAPFEVKVLPGKLNVIIY